jgi:hypothetical protein
MHARSLVRSTLALVVLCVAGTSLPSAVGFAADPPEVEAPPAIVLLPEATIREVVFTGDRFHFTATQDLVITTRELYDADGSVEHVRAELAPVTRPEMAGSASYVDFYYFPNAIADASGTANAATTRAHMERALFSVFPPQALRERRTNVNQLGDLSIETTQFEMTTIDGGIRGTVGALPFDDGVLVVYAHLDPSSGPRNRGIVQVLETFRAGPAPEAATADTVAATPAASDAPAAAEPEAPEAPAADDHAGHDHAGHDHDDHAGQNH